MINETISQIYFAWIESALLGTYVTLALWQKSNGVGGKCTVGGGVLSFLAFACPICNKFLVFLLGTSFLLSYLQPIQPYLGITGIALLSYALYLKIKLIKFQHEKELPITFTP